MLNMNDLEELQMLVSVLFFACRKKLQKSIKKTFAITFIS